MAEITTADILNTYIKLSKKAKVFTTPQDADKQKNLWFEKQPGEIAGKLYSWIDAKAPVYGSPFGKSLILMFKVNDDFTTSAAKSYYIRIESGLINWEFTRQELIKKSQIGMNFFEKFIDDIERQVKEYGQSLVDYAKSGLKWGIGIGAAVLLGGYVVIPYIKYRALKHVVKTTAKEIKSA